MLSPQTPAEDLDLIQHRAAGIETDANTQSSSQPQMLGSLLSDAAINTMNPTNSNVLSPGINHSKLQTFTPFPRLPSELRNLVWTFALPGPRIIEILRNHSAHHRACVVWKDTHTGLFRIMQTCKEAEDVVLSQFHSFTPRFGIERLVCRIYHITQLRSRYSEPVLFLPSFWARRIWEADPGQDSGCCIYRVYTLGWIIWLLSQIGKLSEQLERRTPTCNEFEENYIGTWKTQHRSLITPFIAQYPHHWYQRGGAIFKSTFQGSHWENWNASEFEGCWDSLRRYQEILSHFRLLRWEELKMPWLVRDASSLDTESNWRMKPQFRDSMIWAKDGWSWPGPWTLVETVNARCSENLIQNLAVLLLGCGTEKKCSSREGIRLMASWPRNR